MVLTMTLHDKHCGSWIARAPSLSRARAISTLKLLNGDLESHFPELAGPIHFINVPSVVMGAWGMFMCHAFFLDPVVVSKVRFVLEYRTS